MTGKKQRQTRCAVLGSPIAHSLSPTLHTAGYRAYGLDDWEYGIHEVTEAELDEFLTGLDASWRGLSLTMPLKRRALELADDATQVARDVGVANTLVRTDSGWLADNTDVGGLVAALRPPWHGYQQAAVLGAGATALSALFALAELGIDQVQVYARDLRKASALRQVAERLHIDVELVEFTDWHRGNHEVLISTLPAGVLGRGDSFKAKLVFDAVYWNWPTEFARLAAASGAIVVSGLDMLVHQACLQFQLFTGHRAPLSAMFAAAAPQPSTCTQTRGDCIALTGFMGAGKTSVGRRLAELIGWNFVDVDAEIEREHGSISSIFADAGEAAFRTIEREAVLQALRVPYVVVALGGGAVETPAIREALKKVNVVWLKISLSAALNRLGNDPTRPVLQSAKLTQRFDDRQSLYDQVANHVVAVGSDSEASEIAANLASLLGKC